MVKLKTNVERPIRDVRGKILGEYIIRLIVSNITIDINGGTASGIYYYKTAEGNEVALSNFATGFSWEDLSMLETVLQPFQTTASLRDAITQRIVELSFMQQEKESGENYETVYTDWVIDED